MSDVVRAALVQTAWTATKASMIDLHEHHARAAASQGAQVICFQELLLRSVLLSGPRRDLLRLRRIRAGRSDDAALHGPRG